MDKDGRGICKWNNGEVYDGNFKDGKFEVEEFLGILMGLSMTENIKMVNKTAKESER